MNLEEETVSVDIFSSFSPSFSPNDSSWPFLFTTGFRKEMKTKNVILFVTVKYQIVTFHTSTSLAVMIMTCSSYEFQDDLCITLLYLIF